MRVFKYLFSILVVVIIVYNSFSISSINYNNEKITVEVKGEVENEGIYELDRDSTFNDLLDLIILKEDADISNISLQDPLYNKQIIVIGTCKENKISINIATVEELCTLNGIGEKTAQAIIDYRESHNGFKYLEELMNVKGIGVKKFEKIKDRISL